MKSGSGLEHLGLGKSDTLDAGNAVADLSILKFSQLLANFRVFATIFDCRHCLASSDRIFMIPGLFET